MGLMGQAQPSAGHVLLGLRSLTLFCGGHYGAFGRFCRARRCPPGPSQQAASAAPSLGQTLADAWDTVVYGVSWFFGNMEPAGIWAIPTLAAAIAFFIYFWKVSAPRKNSLEWIAMAEAQPRQMTLTLKRHPFQKKDVLPMLLVTVIYAVSAFFQLGNTHAPRAIPSLTRTPPSAFPTVRWWM